MLRRLAILSLALASLFGLNAGHASAATGNNTIGVSPALQTLVARKGQSQITYNVTLTNISKEPQTVSVTAADFTAFNGTGQVQFLDPSKPNKEHGLAGSFQFIAPQLLINPGESRLIPVTLGGLDKLTPGGHYGAILLKTSLPSPLKNSNVIITQSVASLVFLSTEGQGTYQLKLRPQSTSLAFFRLPQSLNFVFDNTGNVQATPRGYVAITGPRGLISKTIINSESALVLPGTQRLIQTPLNSRSFLQLPGIYTVRTYYKYQGANDYSFQFKKVVFFNLPLVLSGVVLIGVIVGLIKYFNLLYMVKKCVQKVIHSR